MPRIFGCRFVEADRADAWLVGRSQPPSRAAAMSQRAPTSAILLSANFSSVAQKHWPSSPRFAAGLWCPHPLAKVTGTAC